jgi:ABC-type transport system involved in multi-copper enzyme maturation permease subunit
MPPLLRSELFRLNRRWMPRVLALIVVIGVVLVYALLWVALSTESEADTRELREDLAPAEVPNVAMDIVSFLASLLAVIMSASIVGTEYGWGTIRALLPRARSRVGVLAAKLTALAIFDLVLIVAGFLAGLGMSSLIAAAEEGVSGELGGDFLLESIAAIGRTSYVLLPYTALAFFVAVITRSNAAGIAIGLAVLLAESIVLAIVTAITDLFDWLGDVLFSENAAAITSYNGSGNGDDSLPDPWQAVLVLGLWIVAFVAVSIVIFRRRDVTSGA